MVEFPTKQSIPAAFKEAAAKYASLLKTYRFIRITLTPSLNPFCENSSKIIGFVRL
jgi:hypothetical protein